MPELFKPQSLCTCFLCLIYSRDKPRTFAFSPQVLNTYNIYVEKGMATLSCILAWKIPWREEHGGLQSMELQRTRHDWATKQQHPWTASVLFACIAVWVLLSPLLILCGRAKNHSWSLWLGLSLLRSLGDGKCLEGEGYCWGLRQAAPGGGPGEAEGLEKRARGQTSSFAQGQTYGTTKVSQRSTVD